MDLSSLDAEVKASTDAPTEPAGTPDVDRLFRELVAQHRVRLQRFVVNHIGHHDDADDIAQHAFLEAVRSIDRFRGDSELSTWLYGIAMNLVRNYLNRAPHRLHHFETDDTLVAMPSQTGDPSDLLATQQILRSLIESLSELPSSMREVLILVAVEECSYEDTAAILSVPVGTVRSRLSRARAALKARLRSAGVETS